MGQKVTKMRVEELDIDPQPKKQNTRKVDNCVGELNIDPQLNLKKQNTTKKVDNRVNNNKRHIDEDNLTTQVVFGSVIIASK